MNLKIFNNLPQIYHYLNWLHFVRNFIMNLENFNNLPKIFHYFIDFDFLHIDLILNHLIIDILVIQNDHLSMILVAKIFLVLFINLNK